MSLFFDSLALLFNVFLIPGIVLFIIFAFGLEWFYRKLTARFQTRVGPAAAGPGGILQTFADFIKTSTKEEIVPDGANAFLFKYLPIVAPLPILTALFTIPIISDTPLIDTPADLYMVIFTLSMFAAIQITLGWASGNNFALIGASRTGLQFVSFGIPLVFSAAVPALLAGSFSMHDIINNQNQSGFLFLPNWTVFGVGFISFVIFLVASLAELEKVPFDSPEAETELAGGWTVEYSGRGYAFIILAEELKEVLMVSLAVTLFLGGPFGPLFGTPEWVHPLLYLLYFTVKSFFVMFLLSLISASFARLKISTILDSSWSLLAPLSVLSIVLLVIVA